MRELEPAQHPHVDHDAFPHAADNPAVSEMYQTGELQFPAPTYNTGTAETDPGTVAALDQVNAAATQHNQEAGAFNEIAMGEHQERAAAERAAGLMVDEALGGTEAAAEFHRRVQ